MQKYKSLFDRTKAQIEDIPVEVAPRRFKLKFLEMRRQQIKNMMSNDISVISQWSLLHSEI